MRRRISLRGCFRPSVRPYSRSVTPVRKCVAGASNGQYWLLFFSLTILGKCDAVFARLLLPPLRVVLRMQLRVLLQLIKMVRCLVLRVLRKCLKRLAVLVVSILPPSLRAEVAYVRASHGVLPRKLIAVFPTYVQPGI